MLKIRRSKTNNPSPRTSTHCKEKSLLSCPRKERVPAEVEGWIGTKNSSRTRHHEVRLEMKNMVFKNYDKAHKKKRRTYQRHVINIIDELRQSLVDDRTFFLNLYPDVLFVNFPNHKSFFFFILISFF